MIAAHPCAGYKTFKGQRTEGSELEVLVSGLEANGFLSEYTDLLTGYMGKTSFLEQVVVLVDKLRKLHPKLNYGSHTCKRATRDADSPRRFAVCDPVLGDDGKMYVAKEFVEIYRSVQRSRFLE